MTKIIAEAGVNHNGKYSLAKKLIKLASEAGADYVKFQVFVAEENVTKNASKAQYQIKNTNLKETQFEMLKRYELSFCEHEKLFKYCKKKKINYLATPFDLKSLKFLLDLNIKLLKISSGEIINEPFLKEISKSNCKLILSTGMSNISEIFNAIKILTSGKIKKKDICLLHCNSEYPSPYEDINLKAMITMKNFFNMDVGYSDHSEGLLVPIMAATLGAKYLEKHLTISKSMKGPDHKSSASLDELKQIVINNKLISKILGSGIKKISKSERKNLNVVRKSLFAGCDIRKGEILTFENIKIKRPGTGLKPAQIYKIVGTSAKKNYKFDQKL
jgi:N,N'-diacetyllegionaminate synthase